MNLTNSLTWHVSIELGLQLSSPNIQHINCIPNLCTAMHTVKENKKGQIYNFKIDLTGLPKCHASTGPGQVHVYV